MITIPSNVPVFIENFKIEDRYSTAKLKVFYKGETGDHRLFTKEFSDKILKTLPSTPVVGFYSEDKEDFIGHNNIQYVYGHVPENATIEYQFDENTGNEFAVTDVILYTKREDNIGQVAQKIVGKQHSLELDPNNLEYKINRDSNGVFKNIEFINGQFIGLSVLGDDEKPAFQGSGFFTEKFINAEFVEQTRTNLNKFLDYLSTNGGGIRVFNKDDFFNKIGRCLALTVQEFQEEIYMTLESMGICGYICENTDKYAVIRQFDPDSNRYTYQKYTILTSENAMALVSPVEVKQRFLTEEEIKSLDSNSFAKTNIKENDANSTTDKDDEKLENSKDKDDKGKCTDKEDEENKGKCITEEDKEKDNKAQEGDEDGTTSSKQEEKDKTKMTSSTTSNCASSLSSEEKEELNRYRQAEKINLIDSYTNDLPNEVLDKYKKEVENFSISQLEAALAIEYRKIASQTKTQTIQTFATITTMEDYDENNPVHVVKKYKNR